MINLTDAEGRERVAAALALYDNRAFVIRELSPELDALWHAARAWLDDQELLPAEEGP